MKTALIIAINGNFGYQMALALRDAGWQIKAILRDAAKAPKWLAPKQVFQGSASDEKLVASAANDVDLIVYAANPPYHQWPQLALSMLEPTIRIAIKKRLHILFPGNVYNFAPQDRPISETGTEAPPTDKGAIRVQMEQRLKAAAQNGAKVTIIRAGDYMGPNANTTWLHHIVKHSRHSLTLSLPHGEEHLHFWSYLPDVCANTVKLLEQSENAFEVYHDTGFALTADDWKRALASSNQRVRFKRLPWWLYSTIAPFSPLLREVLKMRYLWRETVVLDGSKMKQALGQHMQQTEFAEVLSALSLTEKKA
ncbi:MAG: epimerase [Reinekea sp.]